METDSKVRSLLKTCRSCMTDIDAPDHISHKVFEMFTYCTNIQVSDTGGLPQQFCVKCSVTIRECYNFIQQAKKVDAIMKDLIFCGQAGIVVERVLTVSPNDQSKIHDVLCDDELGNDYEDCNIVSDRAEFDLVPYNGSESSVTDTAEELNVYKSNCNIGDPKGKANYSRGAALRNERTNQCPICKKSFASKTWYTKHITSVHSNKEYKCTVCHKGFPQQLTLRQHMTTHSEERPHKCKICNKKFKRHKTLHVHERMHREPRLFECHSCGLSFKLKGVLVAHMRIHSDDKAGLCELCGARFTQAGNLAQHMRSHTGEKPYSCEHCDFRCSVSSSMRRHERIHTGSRPHVCAVCAASFHDASGLGRHVRTHTGELPYRCGVCAQAFVDSWKRKSHIMRKHGVKFGEVPPAPSVRPSERTHRAIGRAS